MTLGVCGSYFVFISSTMASITAQGESFWLVTTLTIDMVLSWLRHLSFLAFTSAFGIASLILALAVTSFDASHSDQSVSFLPLPLWQLDSYPLFLGNAGFLYLISTAILPLAQNTEGGAISNAEFLIAFNTSVVFVTILNLAFGLFAWKQYGTCTADNDDVGFCIQTNVIDNLGEGPLTTWVKTLLCVDLLFTSLVYLFPVTQMLELEVFGSEAIEAANSIAATGSGLERAFGSLYSALEWRRNALRVRLVVAVAGVARAVPSFSLLTGLTGGFGNNIFGFILPPLFYHRLRAREGYWTKPNNGRTARLLEQAILLAVFVFGVAFMLLSTASFLAAISSSDDK